MHILENYSCFLVGPIVEYHTQEIHVGILDRLLVDEAVPFKGDSILDVIFQANGLAFGCFDNFRQILHDEVKILESTGKRDAGMAAGASNLVQLLARRPDYPARHAREPVNFVQSLHTAAQEKVIGNQTYAIEFGPHPVVSGA